MFIYVYIYVYTQILCKLWIAKTAIEIQMTSKTGANDVKNSF